MHPIVESRLAVLRREHDEAAGQIEVLRGELELLRARRQALAEEIQRLERGERPELLGDRMSTASAIESLLRQRVEPMRVRDLVAALAELGIETESKVVSAQLGQLRDRGLVESVKRGTWAAV
jgi:DNA-binding transcriptional ArsR family regulator